MSLLATLFLLVAVVFITCGSRHTAMVTFLCTCCYMTVDEGIDIGVSFPIIRLVLMAGILRVFMKGESLSGGLNLMDKIMILWTAWMFFSSIFHKWQPGSGPVYTVGILLDTTGFYFLIRTFCHNTHDLKKVICALCLIILPVALLMIVEQIFHKNIFSVFGSREVPILRDGRYRAQGPFNHAILAGVIGASCFPLALGIWQSHKKIATIGIASSILMIISSASSTPLLSFAFSIFALTLWKVKPVVKPLVMSLIPGYFILSFLMNKPGYWVISRIDLTGSSTGWHRSFLIEQTFKHFEEWWLFGTDKTRHWMPNQGFISEAHTDITNQYISYGVAGGLLAIIMLAILMSKAFKSASLMVTDEEKSGQNAFLFWCLGATLFSHTSSSLAISYFGQSIFFFWLPIALLASFYNYETEEIQKEEGYTYPEFAKL